MKIDRISAVGIDGLDRLYVKPELAEFPHIYLEAMEIQWDDTGEYLHGPPPPRAQLATLHWWYTRILESAHEQGYDLRPGPNTLWNGIENLSVLPKFSG